MITTTCEILSNQQFNVRLAKLVVILLVMILIM